MKKYIITLFSLLALAQVSAWADKYDAHVSALSGNGTRDNPYIINAAADWAILSYSCGKQNEGELDFSGKYIKLNADITVTTIMGRESGVPFKGHFDGNGHTITVNYTASDDYCAPLPLCVGRRHHREPQGEGYHQHLQEICGGHRGLRQGNHHAGKLHQQRHHQQHGKR